MPSGRGRAFAARAPGRRAGCGYIASWRPPSVSADAGFARPWWPQAAPGGRNGRRPCWRQRGSWLTTRSRSAGPGPRGAAGTPSVIERFATCAPGLSGVTRRTLRTTCGSWPGRWCPALGSRGVAPLPASTPRLPTARRRSPAATSALASAQPTLARRMTAAALVSLGAGAGLDRHGLRAVRGADVGLPVRRGRRGGPRRPAAGGAGAGPLPRPAAGIRRVRCAAG